VKSGKSLYLLFPASIKQMEGVNTKFIYFDYGVSRT